MSTTWVIEHPSDLDDAGRLRLEDFLRTHYHERGITIRPHDVIEAVSVEISTSHQIDAPATIGDMLDRAQLLIELGEVLFSLNRIVSLLDSTFVEAMEVNAANMRKRYGLPGAENQVRADTPEGGA